MKNCNCEFNKRTGENRKRYQRYTVLFAVFTAVIVSLYLLLVLSAAVPNAAIQNNMRSSAKYYIGKDRYAFTEEGLYQNITDNYADQIWLNIGWQMGIGNPFVSALDTQYYDGMEHGVTTGLYLTVTRGTAANTEYTRYWHGTAGVLRILHLFTDIQGIKNIGMVCLILLVWKTLTVLVRAGHGDLGVCLAASLLLVQAWNLRLSAEYLPCFLVCFGLCPAFLRLERKGDFYLEILAVISGILTAFFDFLTTETVTILVPLILVVAIRSKERRLVSPRNILKLLLGCGLCWFFAYIGTFVVKWSLVSFVTKQNYFLSAVSSLNERMDGVVIAGLVQKKPGLLMGIAANLTVFFGGITRIDYLRIIVLMSIVVVFLILIYRMFRIRQKPRPGTMFLLLLGGVVLLRYGILANHSYMHAFFTYRALLSTVLAVLSAMTVNLRLVKRNVSEWK